MRSWWRLFLWWLRRQRGSFRFNIGPVGRKGTTDMVEITLTNEQKVKVTATPVTATGKPAPVDGAVVFTVQAGDCTVNELDDFSAEIVSGDNPGDSVILVSADADLGDGVETVADTVTVHVEGARAASLGLTVGAPEPK